MSTPTPSTPAPQGPQPGSPSAIAPTLSPLSPDAAVKLEPLSASDSDKTALPPSPLERATSSFNAGKSRHKRKPSPYRWAIWLVSFLIFGLIAAIFGLVYITTGSISGTEFDAVNWTSRDFHFMRDPFTETQLTNIKHSASRFTVDPIIAAHISGGPARPTVPRWDLVQISRGMSPAHGEAHILLAYLQTRDSQGNYYWVEWTTNNPKAAPVLWGAVRDAAHLERYDRLPEIFDRVRVDDDPNVLKTALAAIMLDLALDEAHSRVKAGDQKGARLAASVGLTYGQSARLRALAASASQAE